MNRQSPCHPTYSVLTDITGYPGIPPQRQRGTTYIQLRPLSASTATARGCRRNLVGRLPGASGYLGCHGAQPDLQPDAGRDRGRRQQLDQHQLGSAGDDQPRDQRNARQLPPGVMVRRLSTSFRRLKVKHSEPTHLHPRWTSSAIRGRPTTSWMRVLLSSFPLRQQSPASPADRWHSAMLPPERRVLRKR